MPFLRKKPRDPGQATAEAKQLMAAKADSEFAYWQRRKDAEGTLLNHHYQRFFTDHFDLDIDDFEGTRMLDIGCGPRGSLEWAAGTALRVGVDPLADRYRALGTSAQAMSYVAAGGEALPFADESFDVVSSLNSLDHVDVLDETISEIKRVLVRGGTFLLMADIHHHQPTVNEPSPFSWDIVHKFEPELRLSEQRQLEKEEPGMYQSVEAAKPYDHENPTDRYGVLVAKFVR